MNRCANRMRKANLLTAGEEAALALTIQEGLRAAERIASADESGKDIAELETKVRAGQAAKGRFVEANMGLVRSIANRYMGRGLDFEDLVQEGVFGLMRAAEKFDPGMGNRFSTYASWWIRQSMGKAVNSQSRTIRIPEKLSERLGKIARKASELEQELGREPKDCELDDALGLPRGKASETKMLAMEPASLDAPFAGCGEDDEDKPRSLLDTVRDQGQDIPGASLCAHDVGMDVSAAISALTEREREVIALRYGLGEENPKSPDDVARELGLAVERAEQIEFKALARLRSAIGRSSRPASA